VTFLESIHPILDMDDKEHKQVVISSLQSDLKTKDIAQEQSEVKDEASLSPFSHQPEVHTHVFEDPLIGLLETFVKVDFVVFMDYGCQFQVEIEFPALKFFFLFTENERREQSSSHLLVWLHCIFYFTSSRNCSWYFRIGRSVNKLDILSIFFSSEFFQF
jgi:hypothetical protein